MKEQPVMNRYGEETFWSWQDLVLTLWGAGAVSLRAGDLEWGEAGDREAAHGAQSWLRTLAEREGKVRGFCHCGGRDPLERGSSSSMYASFGGKRWA